MQLAIRALKTLFTLAAFIASTLIKLALALCALLLRMIWRYL